MVASLLMFILADGGSAFSCGKTDEHTAILLCKTIPFATDPLLKCTYRFLFMYHPSIAEAFLYCDGVMPFAFLKARLK